MRAPVSFILRRNLHAKCAECDFWLDIRRGHPVRVDWLVSYPLDVIYLRFDESVGWSQMSITGYATSRSRSAALTRLLAQFLTRATQEVLSAHVGDQLPL